MGGAPVVETVRPGVQLVSAAADSFRRLEARVGRPIDVNSTYRDWNTQLSMYNAWMRYVNSGYKPAYKPNHSRALHPDYSKHCQGLALDSDDWASPGFINLAREYGWVRTAANDPTEQHHFEYQWWEDTHRNDPVPTGGGAANDDIKEFPMFDTLYVKQTDGKAPDKNRIFAIFRDPRTGELVKDHIKNNKLWAAIEWGLKSRGVSRTSEGMLAADLDQIPTWKK